MTDINGTQPAAAAVDSKVLNGITAQQDFTYVSEVFRGTNGGEGQSKFFCSVFTLIDTEDNATIYSGQVNIPLSEVSLEQAKQSLTRIPDETLYPVLPAELQAYAMEQLPPPDTQYYLKRHKFSDYRDAVGTTELADHLLEEAQTLDLLRRNPHPNVGVCYGHWVPPNKHGRMAGIVLHRYSMTLHDYMRLQDSALGSEDPAPAPTTAPTAAEVRADDYMQELTAAVDHLHSLGIAHNDISPRHIMLDENGSIKLVDMGSCKPFGQELTEWDTALNCKGFEEVSAKKNDEIGLRKVQEWLGQPVVQPSMPPELVY